MFTVRDGTGSSRFCFSPGGGTLVASNVSIDTMRINGSAGATEWIKLDGSAAGFQGEFSPGATKESIGKSDIEVSINSGAGDLLQVVGTSAADSMSAFGGSLAGVDLNNDGDQDVSILAPQRVELDGGPEKDFLIGISTSGIQASYPLTLDGGPAADTIIGGGGKDVLVGGVGFDNDFLSSVDFNRGHPRRRQRLRQRRRRHAGHRDQRREHLPPGGRRPRRGRAHAARRRRRQGHAAAALDAPEGVALAEDHRRPALRRGQAVGRATLRPASGRITGTGAAKGAKGTLTHKGKTVSARVKLHLPRSLDGRTLRVDIRATDAKAHTQLEAAARAIRG